MKDGSFDSVLDRLDPTNWFTRSDDSSSSRKAKNGDAGNGSTEVASTADGPTSPEATPDEPSIDADDHVIEMDDAERIYNLVDAHDGKMWQSDIVEANDWSKSLVSRRLSDLEDRGWVRRIQKGRQKAVFTLDRDQPGDATDAVDAVEAAPKMGRDAS